MELVLNAINTFFDWIWPAYSPGMRYAVIVAVSIFSAFIFLIIFKKFSNQEAISREKGKIIGNIIEIRIYQDKLLQALSNILKISKHNMIYLGYTLPPLAIMIIPLIIITTQINNRCGYQPLKPGESFLVHAVFDINRINSFDPFLDTVSCKTSLGVELETPILRIPEKAMTVWRAKVKPIATAGNEWVEIQVEGRQVLHQKVAVFPGENRFEPMTTRFSFPKSLIHNANDFIPDDSVFESFTIQYERQKYPFLNRSTDSLVLYFLFTLAFALVLKPAIKVKI
jgi:hypothetical protein